MESERDIFKRDRGAVGSWFYWVVARRRNRASGRPRSFFLKQLDMISSGVNCERYNFYLVSVLFLGFLSCEC